MKSKLSERFAAVSLSLAMLMSCCVPYGLAVEANDTEAVAVAEDTAVFDTAAETDAKASEDAEAVDTAAETDEAESETEDAEVSDTAAEADAEASEDAEAVETAAETAFLYAESTGLTDFSSFNHEDLLSIDAAAGAVTLGFAEGDHFVVYNGLDHKINSFVWETDVDFPDGLNIKSAALIFGFPSKLAPNSNWYGANLDSTRVGQDNAFRLFGPNIDTNSGGSADGIDLTKTLHFKVDIHATGAFEYSFGNKGAEAKTISGTISGWRGGYVGF